MKTILQLGALVIVLVVAGCAAQDEAAPGAETIPGVHPWALPAAAGAGQPDLVTAPDGRLLLSWLDTKPGRRTRLQYADYSIAGRWTGPKTVAVGSSFFVNWADTPHLIALPSGALWMQWLQKSAQEGLAYDVVLSSSRNDGMNWSEPFRPHSDRSATEHGFATLWAQGSDRLGLAWLDGRNMATAGASGAGHAAHGSGAMTLRSAVIDAGPRLQGGEIEIDSKVCDCCQTAAAMTRRGPLLVYRGRDDNEIRDILTTRFDGRAWSAPKPVFADRWVMPACPVNGPDVAAHGDIAVVGWFSAAGGQPTVKLARSDDAGDRFAAPVIVDQGAPVQGRVAVALDEAAVWVLWLREEGHGQTLMLARYAPDLSRQLERITVAKLQGRGRGTGFAQLALRAGKGHVVWTDLVEGTSALNGALVVPESGASAQSEAR